MSDIPRRPNGQQNRLPNAPPNTPAETENESSNGSVSPSPPPTSIADTQLPQPDGLPRGPPDGVSIRQPNQQPNRLPLANRVSNRPPNEQPVRQPYWRRNRLPNGVSSGQHNQPAVIQREGTPYRQPNEQLNGVSSGQTNAQTVELPNGLSNGYPDGPMNGRPEGQLNGHSYGHTNGVSSGQPNGLPNGQTNQRAGAASTNGFPPPSQAPPAVSSLFSPALIPNTCVHCEAERVQEGPQVVYTEVPENYDNYSAGCVKYVHNSGYRSFDQLMNGTGRINLILDHAFPIDDQTVLPFHVLRLAGASNYFSQRIAARDGQYTALYVNEPDIVLYDPLIMYAFGQHVYNEDHNYRLPPYADGPYLTSQLAPFFHCQMYLLGMRLGSTSLWIRALDNFDRSLYRIPSNYFWFFVTMVHATVLLWSPDGESERLLRNFGAESVAQFYDEPGFHLLRERLAFIYHRRLALHGVSQTEFCAAANEAFPTFQHDVENLDGIVHPIVDPIPVLYQDF